MDLDLEEYDFPLSEDRIAKFPVEKRDHSKLLAVQRSKNLWTDFPFFYQIESLLRPGDILVYNETKVSPRRAYLTQPEKTRVHEVLFLEKRDNPERWLCLLKHRAKLKVNDVLRLLGAGDSLEFRLDSHEEEMVLLSPNRPITEEDFEAWGSMPIPPYLKRKAEPSDKERYQTVFAKHAGSVAAPTAGLHFTEELMSLLKSKGVTFLPVLLQVGYGTFRPLSETQIQAKTLHSEQYLLLREVADQLNQAKAEGRRVIAIGTTTLRVLASVYQPLSKTYAHGEGSTNIFIMPGDSVDCAEGLITNFHLPKSSLLLLVSAFAGKDLVLGAYRHALAHSYRFFSYGDAMFLH